MIPSFFGALTILFLLGAVSALLFLRAQRLTWWMACLFMIGAALFAAGSTSGYAELVGSDNVAITFFVGSLFFTSAAYLQFLAAVNGERKGAAWRWWALMPESTDWLSSAVQLVGTLLFNANTLDGLLTHLSAVQAEEFVWIPDFIGSICFLIASWLGLRMVSRSPWSQRARSFGWWIAALNMLGSITFGIAAVAAFYQIQGDAFGTTIADEGTLAGALCFFVGAWLLLPQAFSDRASP